MKRFDYCIGNPPYQEENTGDNKEFASPIYHKFLDSAYTISDKVEMIHPARFLFLAGSTPKAWNEKMLNDSHFKVLRYHEDASEVFPNTLIKGGVAITYHDSQKKFAEIGIYSKYEEVNSVHQKVCGHENFIPLSTIMENQTRFNLDTLYIDYPEYRNVIGSGGKDKRFRNNIFEKVSLFATERSEDDIEVLGVVGNKRQLRYFPRKYTATANSNIDSWKTLIVRVNGTGALGETISRPVVMGPNQGYTQTFIGIGSFASRIEADNVVLYVKTKFARTLLSVYKITQDNSIDVWRAIPLQDFTPASDIDWSRSIPEIDQQLYKKYGLSPEEIDFIETHVKEMK